MLNRFLTIIKKEINSGSRSPIIILGLAIPVIMTLLIQLSFGGIFSQKPTLAVHDNQNQILTILQSNQAIHTIQANTTNEVISLVESRKADMGVILPTDAKDKINQGETVELELYIHGESLAKDRTITGSAIIGALRQLDQKNPEVLFKEVSVGEEKSISVLELMIPMIVLVSILFGAFFLPATFLVQEKEKKTLTALLVTPVKTHELLAAYGFLGFIISFASALMVIVLNVGWPSNPLIILLLALGALLLTEWGLIAGIIFDEMNSLFANMKMLGILIYAPAIFLWFPNWPDWIAKLFPTYYLINPIFRIIFYSEGWDKLGWEILGLIIWCFLSLVPLILLRTRLNKFS